MTNIQASPQTTVNAAKPMADQATRESEVAGAGLGNLVHSSNCEIAAILGQYLVESMHGLKAGTEKALATAP